MNPDRTGKRAQYSFGGVRHDGGFTRKRDVFIQTLRAGFDRARRATLLY